MNWGGELIRIVGTSPSIFETPEDPDFEEICAENFRTREGEDAISLWCLPSDCDEAFQVLGSFSALRDKARKLRYLRIPHECFEKAGVMPRRSPSNRVFGCVADYHYSLQEMDVSQMAKFAGVLRRRLQTNPFLYVKYSRTRIRRILCWAHLSCCNELGESNYAQHDLQDWTQALIEKRSGELRR